MKNKVKKINKIVIIYEYFCLTFEALPNQPNLTDSFFWLGYVSSKKLVLFGCSINLFEGLN